MPMVRSRKGAATKDSANTAPMVEPMNRHGLGALRLVVRSATMAMETAETAPAPWRTRR